MKPHPFAHLGDAALSLALVLALLFGVDAKWVVLIYLLCELLSHVCKALCAILDPFIKMFGPAR